MGAFTAAMGVGGGAPPAIVEITYCCAHAAVPLAKRSPNPIKALSFIYPRISFSIAVGFGRPLQYRSNACSKLLIQAEKL